MPLSPKLTASELEAPPRIVCAQGAIQPGTDADLVVYDPDYRAKISAKTQQMNLDYNSFESFEIEGRPHVVIVRGKIAARDGKFIGESGRGKFLRREPNRF